MAINEQDNYTDYSKGFISGQAYATAKLQAWIIDEVAHGENDIQTLKNVSAAIVRLFGPVPKSGE